MRPEDRYDSLIKFYAEEKNVDWLLLKAQIKAESNFDPDAISPVKALGLAQFMRATWEEWKDGTAGIQNAKLLVSRRNPEASIKAQAAYMKWLFKFCDKTNLSNEFVLAAYNWGIGNVLKTVKKYGYLKLDVLPVETYRYINKINLVYKEYKAYEKLV